MNLKIRSVELVPVAVARHTGYRCHHVIVRIRTEEGLEGIGEMSDFSHLPRYMPDLGDLQKVLNQLLAGKDARDLNAIDQLMLENFPEAHYYYTKATFIRCGVDIALHDLVAKALGEPVSTLLGGRCRDRFKVCYPIFRLRSVQEVEANLKIVADRLEQGFDVFRFYAGANLDADEAFLKELRARFGERVVIKSLDFSHLLDWKEARSAVRRLEKYGFLMVESPAKPNDFEGLAKVREAIDHPVSEHVWSHYALWQMIRHDSVDIFNIAPIFIGGLTAARRAFAAAAAAGKRCLIGTTQELSVGVAAQAQLGAAMANLTDISDPTGPELYVDDVVEEKVKYENGYLLVPPADVPGLGVSLNEEKLKALTEPMTWADVPVANVLDRTATAPKG